MSDVTLSITDLRIDVEGPGHDIVDEVTLQIPKGQVLGLVGESGSGKTTVGLAVLGHARKGVVIHSGTIDINGQSLLARSPKDLRSMRGSLVTYVPQDPSMSLNPALRINTQILEVLEQHGFGANAKERQERVNQVMSEVALPGVPEFLRRYPHQLSGGQQQRVGLAMAFACRPAVIVLDEPTTGLDVSTQSHVLATVRELCRQHGVAALYVTHDLAVVANLADRVAVMYAGRIVEQGPTRMIFDRPQHPYTRHLTAAAPDISGEFGVVGLRGRAPAPGKRPVGCAFAPRCSMATEVCATTFPAEVSQLLGHSVRCHHAGTAPDLRREAPNVILGATAAADIALDVRSVNASYTGSEVVHQVSFSVARGECVALVGESGSGKTTISRSVGGLHREWTGEILLNGVAMQKSSRDRPTKQRLSIQYVFQNPYSSLHPRRTVGESVARPLRVAGASEREAAKAAGEMLERVSLTAAYANRYPDQLSGGERQRVAIARALVCKPSVLVCDEVTSALDVLVQAAVVELLVSLQRDLGLSMLFVTHNLPLVRSLAQTVVVLADGKVVEAGPTERILTNPVDAYTQRLLADTPSIAAALAAG
ncbi:MAG: hypothetical protein RJA49_385 [Actinomycetota bacterium]